MYPLKVVVVGCNDTLLPRIREELHNQPAALAAEFHDVTTALEKRRLAPHDAVLLVFHLKGLKEIDELHELKRVYTGCPILALVETCKEQSSTLLLMANRAGASQVVPLPLESEDFQAALEAIGLEVGYAGTTGRAIAVSGVTGGSGGTTLAINLAYEMVHLAQLKCIVTELAFQKGMLATYLNVEPKYVIHDLLCNDIKLDLHVVERALTRVSDNFYILSGAHHAIMPLSVTSRDVGCLLEYARRLAQVVVLDVPCTSNDLYAETLTAADQIVLVAEPTVPSLRSLKLVLDMLGRSNVNSGRDDASPIHVVINRYDPRVEDCNLRHLKELLEVPHLLTLANDYAAASSALNSGVPLRQKCPKSRLLVDIDNVVRVLLGQGDPTQNSSRLWSLVNKVTQAFARTN